MVAREETIEKREAELLEVEQRVRLAENNLESKAASFGQLGEQSAEQHANLQKRETEVAAREAELNRQLATLRRVERDEGLAAELEHKQQGMLERERELAAREAELQSTEALFESQRERIERREKRLNSTEESLSDRIREMDEREAEVEAREARVEADLELREEKLERRELKVAELEERLGKKESQLSDYVGQLQGKFDQRESDWWDKQLGQPVTEKV